MRPHQGSVEGKENLPRPAGHTLLDAPQDPIGFLRWKKRKKKKPPKPKHINSVLKLLIKHYRS